MTKKSSYEPLSSSSTEATNGRGQPSTAAHLGDDDDDSSVIRHVLVSLIMCGFFALSAAQVWQDAGHHWYNVIVTAIAFLYSMLMIHLLLIKRRDRKKKSQLESCQMASVLTVAATGMLISLGVALYVFRPAWSDLAFIALMVSLCTGLTFLLLKHEEIERKKMLKEKSADASDLV